MSETVYIETSILGYLTARPSRDLAVAVKCFIALDDWRKTMQITIDLPPDLEQELIRQAAQSNVPLQTLILQALRQMTQTPPSTSWWSEVILSYEGIPDFPPFEGE